MEHAFHLEALKVPFQTINNKVDRKNLISEKCYALKCKKINIKIVVVLIWLNVLQRDFPIFQIV